MKLTTSLAALAIVTGALTSVTGSAAYAVETCFGLTPTIVGAAGDKTLRGTEGDDVIVDTFGHAIEALGGNDMICSVGSRWISAGEGDDRVRVVDAGKGNFTFLGLGSDHYVGSEANDRVAAGAFDSTEILQGAPGDSDTITTMGGEDRVHSIAWSYANADVIDLGAGPDSLRLTSLPGATFAVEGGDGRDSIEFDHYHVRADLDVDLGTGTVAFDTPSAARATGFEDAYASSERHQVTMRGTSGSNVLGVSSQDALVLGLGGNDDIHVSGCGAVARGNGGADELESSGCRREPISLYGGGGRDSLRGRNGPDVLIGNGGRDSARGGKGRDTCQAEMERSCERS